MSDKVPMTPEVAEAVKMITNALAELHFQEGLTNVEARKMATVAVAKLCTAVEAATLASLLPEGEVLEAATYAATAALGDSGVEIDVLLDTRRARHLTEAALRAAAPILLADKEREVERLSKAFREASRRATDAGEFEMELERVVKERDAAEARVAAMEGALNRSLESLRTIAQLLHNPADAGHLIHGGNAFKLARDTYIAESTLLDGGTR